jgi:hypothetical protein
MVTHDDVRRMAAKLPGAAEGEDRFGFSVPFKGKHKGFTWTWLERVHPKKARVENDGVLAVLVPGLGAKELILSSSDGKKIFTEPHYNGYPAVLVRLALIEPDEFEELLIEAWRSIASADLRRQYDLDQESPA